MTRRGRRALAVLLLVVVGVPVLEVVVLIQVGQAIGGWWTLLLVVLDWFVGAWLIKREGRRAWRALREQVQGGRPPSHELADSVLVVLGGALLMWPGFLTDLVAIALIVPFTRPLFRGPLTSYAAARVVPGQPGQNGPRPGPDVVQGEVIDDE